MANCCNTRLINLVTNSTEFLFLFQSATDQFFTNKQWAMTAHLSAHPGVCSAPKLGGGHNRKVGAQKMFFPARAPTFTFNFLPAPLHSDSSDSGFKTDQRCYPQRLNAERKKITKELKCKEHLTICRRDPDTMSCETNAISGAVQAELHISGYYESQVPCTGVDVHRNVGWS